MTRDERFIDEALELAKKGIGWTSPNPMVGAVIVKNGKIVGRGYHRQAGKSHAEIEAIRSAGKNAKVATLYVNLEPCPHWGRTPPCTDAIISAGIKRVVCSALDPNPKVHGFGIAALRRAGIKVAIGARAARARALNEPFFTFHEMKRPYVAIKFAASLDGKLGTRTGDSKWITNEKARKFTRDLRGQYQAVLIGASTVIKDDPHLGARNNKLKDPIRIIIDGKLSAPISAQVFRDSNALVATTTSAPKSKIKRFQKHGTSTLVFDGRKIQIKKLLSELARKEIISVLVEGGGETIGNFIDAKLVDKVYAFYAPIIIGGKDAISIGGNGADSIRNALQLKTISLEKFDDNILVTGNTHGLQF